MLAEYKYNKRKDPETYIYITIDVYIFNKLFTNSKQYYAGEPVLGSRAQNF